jgi:hypothetical protein
MRNKQEVIDKFFSSRNFEVAAFDIKAALELSILRDPDLQGKKDLDDNTTRAKIKFDRQIVAIAKVRGADCLYTDDGNLAKVSRNNRIAAVRIWDIPLPPLPPYIEMDLRPRE